MKAGLKITSIGLIIFFVFIFKAHASNHDYQACVNRCYLDIPEKSQFIVDEKKYWDSKNVTDPQFDLDYKSMVKHAKIDCQINCCSKQIKFIDSTEKFYDSDVKNFPETRSE